jgi:hypothetical protein
MSQIPGSFPTGPDHKIYEKNAQHTGQASEGVSKKERDRLASAGDAEIVDNSSDSVQISTRGKKSAEHTGKMQRMAKKSEASMMPESLTEQPSLDLLAGLPSKGPLAMAADQPQAGAPVPGTPNAGGPGATPPSDPATPPPADPGTPPPGNQPAPAPPPSTPASDAAQRAKVMQDDLQAAQSIYMQMAADRQKWLMEMWKILQDTQTAIFNIIQAVILNREKVAMDMAEKWAAVLGGYAK